MDCYDHAVGNGVVALSGMTGPGVSAQAAPTPEAGDWEIAVFLCTPSSVGCHKRYATAKQRRDVERFLKATPEVTEVRFVSRASAYANFRREFAGQQKVLAGVRAKDVPESFRVRVSGVADRAKITESANRRPEVGLAIDQAESQVGKERLAHEADIVAFLCMKESGYRPCRKGRGKAVPGLESYVYEDQATAYRSFVEYYADNEALVSAVRVSDMPESYRLTMRQGADWGTPIRLLVADLASAQPRP